MNTRFQIKDHAVHRYIERHRPDLEYAAARAELDAALANATPRKDRPLRRGVLFHLGTLGVDVIAIPENRMHVVVTVLPPLRDLAAERRDEFEEMQAYEQRAKARAAELEAAEAKAKATHEEAHHKATKLGSERSRARGPEWTEANARYQVALAELRASKDRLSALHLEVPAQREILKTFRHAITRWQDELGYKEAARAAIAALVEISATCADVGADGVRAREGGADQLGPRVPRLLGRGARHARARRCTDRDLPALRRRGPGPRRVRRPRAPRALSRRRLRLLRASVPRRRRVRALRARRGRARVRLRRRSLRTARRTSPGVASGSGDPVLQPHARDRDPRGPARRRPATRRRLAMLGDRRRADPLRPGPPSSRIRARARVQGRPATDRDPAARARPSVPVPVACTIRGMPDPATLEEYQAKSIANVKYEGHGLSVAMVMPCPFCAEPDWLRHLVLEVESALARGATCKSCGRGAKAIFERNAGGVKFEIVQVLGDPPAPYLPPMRRLPDLVSYGHPAGPGCSYCSDGTPHRHAEVQPVDRTAVTTTDGQPPAPGMEHGKAPAPQPPTASGQHGAYFVLSDEERAKGYQRPVRDRYKHVGRPGPRFPGVRLLTDEEKARYPDAGYVRFEPYPESERPTTGKFWTQAELDRIGKGCGAVTRMAAKIAETYAREPTFYGATFCVGCGTHLPVGEDGEFVWDDDTRVGT